jgi:poly [ADP-ribose] polymerase 10/14/15
MSTANIESLIREINRICEESKGTKTLNKPFVMNFVETMSDDQRKQFDKLAMKHSVNIDISRLKGITLSGPKDGIVVVADAIRDSILENRSEQMQQMTELLGKQAVWEFDASGSGKFTKYDRVVAGKLETSYGLKQAHVQWTDQKTGDLHDVSLHKWLDRVQQRGGATVEHKVRRYQQGEIRLPHRWDKMQSNERVKVVQLNSSSDEYKKVESNLKSTGNVNSIVKIERIQNPFLYKQYKTCKLEMDKKNGPGSQNEQRMWHGTDGSNVSNINERNFNRIYGGVHGLAIGHGVYFATQASYSINGYSRPGPNGHKHIYQARVLSGKIGQGAGGMKEPPPGFDSVGNSSMCVVFYDAQAYPEYLITFT